MIYQNISTLDFLTNTIPFVFCSDWSNGQVIDGQSYTLLNRYYQNIATTYKAFSTRPVLCSALVTLNKNFKPQV